MFEAMPFIRALVRLRVLNGEEAAILLATRIAGEWLSALARQRGVGYEALRKRAGSGRSGRSGSTCRPRLRAAHGATGRIRSSRNRVLRDGAGIPYRPSMKRSYT